MTPKTEIASFAMGCFWGTEALYGVTPGVIRTKVGYTGGTTPNPTYKNIADHTETVELEYDPSVISYSVSCSSLSLSLSRLHLSSPSLLPSGTAANILGKPRSMRQVETTVHVSYFLPQPHSERAGREIISRASESMSQNNSHLDTAS